MFLRHVVGNKNIIKFLKTQNISVIKQNINSIIKQII